MTDDDEAVVVPPIQAFKAALPAHIAQRLVVLIGGPRDGWVYDLDTTPVEMLHGYRDTGRMATLAELYPHRYLTTRTRDQSLEVWS